jgi:hypothetical protein
LTPWQAAGCRRFHREVVGCLKIDFPHALSFALFALSASAGAMTNVNALSGQVGDVAFSILCDSCPQSSTTIKAGIDDIAVLFAELPETF